MVALYTIMVRFSGQNCAVYTHTLYPAWIKELKSFITYLTYERECKHYTSVVMYTRAWINVPHICADFNFKIRISLHTLQFCLRKCCIHNLWGPSINSVSIFRCVFKPSLLSSCVSFSCPPLFPCHLYLKHHGNFQLIITTITKYKLAAFIYPYEINGSYGFVLEDINTLPGTTEQGDVSYLHSRIKTTQSVRLLLSNQCNAHTDMNMQC